MVFMKLLCPWWTRHFKCPVLVFFLTSLSNSFFSSNYSNMSLSACPIMVEPFEKSGTGTQEKPKIICLSLLLHLLDWGQKQTPRPDCLQTQGTDEWDSPTSYHSYPRRNTLLQCSFNVKRSTKLQLQVFANLYITLSLTHRQAQYKILQQPKGLFQLNGKKYSCIQTGKIQTVHTEISSHRDDVQIEIVYVGFEKQISHVEPEAMWG